MPFERAVVGRWRVRAMERSLVVGHGDGDGGECEEAEADAIGRDRVRVVDYLWWERAKGGQMLFGCHGYR